MFGSQFRLYAYIGAGVLVLVCLAWMYASGMKAGAIKDAKRSAPIIAKLDADLKLCTANLDAVTISLEAQNAAVGRLKAEGDERTKRADAAIREAQKQAQTYKAKADRIARAKPSGDVCVAARSLIVETLSGDRQ